MRIGVLLLVAAVALPAAAEKPERFRIDGGLTFSRFEQQVKSEIGGATGERLVEQTDFGLALLGSWRFWGPFSVGLYTQLDVGSRGAGNFKALDADNKTVIEDETGGSYTEFWMGPFVRAQWRTLFLEVAYAPLGIRSDDARADLPTADGDTDTALRTSYSVAWYAALGGGVPVTDALEVVMRLEFRVRYYNRRGSDKLADELVHGTQNWTPFVGVAWKL